MYYTKDQALNGFQQNFDIEVDDYFYNSKADLLLRDNWSRSKDDWWDGSDKEIQQVIDSIKIRLGHLYHDVKSIEDGSYGEDVIKQDWEENIDDVQDEYEDWDDYEGSKDYYRKIEFYSEVGIQDIRDEYNDILEYLDLDNILSEIDDIIEELNGMLEIKNGLRKKAMRETIKECFDDE